MPGRMIMTFEQLGHHATQGRKASESLYLLLDPGGDYSSEQPLHISRLIAALGAEAVTRIARPGMEHAPEQWPALVQLAAPGQPIPEYFALSTQFAATETAAKKPYVCGWLFSEHSADAIGTHITRQCQALQPKESNVSPPWYEPIRLALLRLAMKNVGQLLGPIRTWFYPTISGEVAAIEASPLSAELVVPELARDVQRFAPQITQLLAVWRRLNTSQQTYAPWRFSGDTGLPNNAPSHAFNLIYEAHRRGLRDREDIHCLCLHTLMIHPLLMQHPTIENDVQQAVSGRQALEARFSSYDDAIWAQIASKLPDARSYS